MDSAEQAAATVVQVVLPVSVRADAHRDVLTATRQIVRGRPRRLTVAEVDGDAGYAAEVAGDGDP